VLSGNSLQIVVSDDKEEEKEKEEIIKRESVKGEAVKGKAVVKEEREYTVTPARFIASIDLITY
jgi:hypothetical protein